MDWKSLLRASFRHWAASLSLNVLAIVSNWVKETAGLRQRTLTDTSVLLHSF